MESVNLKLWAHCSFGHSHIKEWTSCNPFTLADIYSNYPSLLLCLHQLGGISCRKFPLSYSSQRAFYLWQLEGKFMFWSHWMRSNQKCSMLLWHASLLLTQSSKAAFSAHLTHGEVPFKCFIKPMDTSRWSYINRVVAARNMQAVVVCLEGRMRSPLW